MTLNCFPGLWGSHCYSQSPHSNVLFGFSFCFATLKNLLEVILNMLPCSTFKITLNNFLKIRIAIFFSYRIPFSTKYCCTFLLWYSFQKSLKVRGEGEISSFFHFSLLLFFMIFNSRLLPGGDLRIHKRVRHKLMLQESPILVWEITETYTWL